MGTTSWVIERPFRGRFRIVALSVLVLLAAASMVIAAPAKRAFAAGWSAQESLGGTTYAGPSAVSWGPGRVDVFVVGSDGAAYHKFFQTGSSGWSNWENLGGVFVGLDAASWQVGRLDIVGKAPDGSVWHKDWQNGYGWSAWEGIGGAAASNPGVVSWGSGRLDIFVEGRDGALWHQSYQSGYGWLGWQSLGGQIQSSPDASSWTPGRLDVFAQGQDGSLWHRAYQGGTGWLPWEGLGGQMYFGPGAVSWEQGRIDIFVTGRDYAVYHKMYTPGTGWTAFEYLGGFLSAGPDASSWGIGRVDVYGTDWNYSVVHRYYAPSLPTGGVVVYGDYTSTLAAEAALRNGWTGMADIGGYDYSANPPYVSSTGQDANVQAAMDAYSSDGYWLSFWTVSGPASTRVTWYSAGYQAGQYAAHSIDGMPGSHRPTYLVIDAEGIIQPGNATQFTDFVNGWAAGITSVDSSLRPGFYGNQSQFSGYGLTALAYAGFVGVHPIANNSPSISGGNVTGYISYYATCPADGDVTTAQGWERQFAAPYNTVQFGDSGQDCGP